MSGRECSIRGAVERGSWFIGSSDGAYVSLRLAGDSVTVSDERGKLLCSVPLSELREIYSRETPVVVPNTGRKAGFAGAIIGAAIGALGAGLPGALLACWGGWVTFKSTSRTRHPSLSGTAHEVVLCSRDVTVLVVRAATESAARSFSESVSAAAKAYSAE